MAKTSFKPYEGDENYVFVSYAHSDSDDVFPILERLNLEGYRIWYDEGISPGEEWPEVIAEHVAKSTIVLSFLSPNANASKYFRREITFAINEDKPVLGIILRETDMTPGIKLQFDLQQWISKYAYLDDDEFYEKLFSSPLLHLCRNSDELLLPAVLSPTTPHMEELSSGAYGSSEHPNSDYKIDAENSGQGFSERPFWQRLGLLSLVLFLFLAMLIAASVIYVHNSGTKVDATPTEAVTASEDEGNQAVEESSNSEVHVVTSTHGRNGLPTPEKSPRELLESNFKLKNIPPEIFWGTLTCIESSADDLSSFSLTYQTANDIELELIALPLSMTVSADEPDHMILTFQDKYGVTYNFIADYTFEEGQLNLSKPSDYTLKETPIFELTDNLQFAVYVKYTNIILYYDDQYRIYENLGRGEDTLTLQGTACSENDTYSGILSVDIDAEDRIEGKACQLFFENGGYSTDAIIERPQILPGLSSDYGFGYSFDSTIRVSMTEEIIPYNGRLQENHRQESYLLGYINTYPYGFIIKDFDNHFYRYQDPVMQLNESPESTVE